MKLQELYNQLDSLQRKDRFSAEDIKTIAALKGHIRQLTRLEVEKQAPREVAPFRPLSETLADIRRHFAERNAQ